MVSASQPRGDRRLQFCRQGTQGLKKPLATTGRSSEAAYQTHLPGSVTAASAHLSFVIVASVPVSYRALKKRLACWDFTSLLDFSCAPP